MPSHLSPQGRPLTPRIYSTQTRFSRQIFLSRRTGMCTSPVARRTFPPASPTNKLPLSVGKTTKHKQRDQNDFATEALKWFLTKLALNKSPSQGKRMRLLNWIKMTLIRSRSRQYSRSLERPKPRRADRWSWENLRFRLNCRRATFKALKLRLSIMCYLWPTLMWLLKRKKTSLM